MGDVLNLQAAISRGVRDKEIKYQFGTIWEVVIIVNHIARQVASLALPDK